MNFYRTLVCAALLATAALAGEKAPVVFNVRDAALSGGGWLKREERDGIQNIGVWNTTNALVTWTNVSLARGTWRVVALYSCSPENAGSDFEVAVGNQRAAFTVPRTRGWGNYVEADLGPVIIRKPEPVSITARVTRVAQQFGINLRAVKLVPES